MIVSVPAVDGTAAAVAAVSVAEADGDSAAAAGEDLTLFFLSQLAVQKQPVELTLRQKWIPEVHPPSLTKGTLFVVCAAGEGIFPGNSSV